MSYGLSNTKISNLTNTVQDVDITAMNTDSATGQEEFFWQNNKWSTYWGYFNTIPELKSALLMKATWICGKGYKIGRAHV